MAENIDLNINIGANVTDLQAQLQKAENLLKQFEAALKKATNVGEINYLNGQIKNLNTTIGSLGQQMNKIGRPTADATNALGNLSRVAQDAPYGFIGIANNLNPLLESFQRLQKESGSAGGALKAMVSGLTGPAGIGIALGVVSSLVVAFGDDIQEFISNKLGGLGEKFQIESDLINKSSSAFVKASTDIDKLKNSFELFQQGSITKDKFLKEFNATLGDTIAKTNDLATAEKFLTDYADTYIEMTFKKAIATEASAQAAKKMLELEISKGTPLTPGIGTALTSIFGNPALIGKQAAESKLALQNGLQGEIDILKNLRKVYDEEANKLQKSLTNTFGVSTNTTKPTAAPKKDTSLSYNAASDLIKQINKTNDLLTPNEIAPEDNYFKDLEKQHTAFAKWQTGWLKMTEKNVEGSYKKQQKDLEELNKEYEQFANTISQNVTSALFGMWDAMAEGQSASQALSEMFGRLLRQMAEMVIKAAIFAGIMSLISGGAASGGVSFMSAFTKILGIPKMAEGGVATGPTLAMIGEGSESEAVLPLSKLGGMLNRTFSAGAMSGGGIGQNGQFVLKGNDLVLALQRSTSSLNLRRG